MKTEIKKYLATIGSQGGRAGRGQSKARTPEQARKAAEARWAGHPKPVVTEGVNHFKIYRWESRGYGWNPNLREWELYEMDPEDGSIQDMVDRVKSKAQAEAWALEPVSKR